MPRDIISINSTHYVGNNMYRLKFFCKYYDLKIKSREIAAGELYYK